MSELDLPFNMSRRMKKSTICICENKGGKREAGQRLCFRYTDSTIPLLAIFFDYTGWFVSDLVGNPTCDAQAHIKSINKARRSLWPSG